MPSDDRLTPADAQDATTATHPANAPATNATPPGQPHDTPPAPTSSPAVLAPPAPASEPADATGAIGDVAPDQVPDEDPEDVDGRSRASMRRRERIVERILGAGKRIPQEWLIQEFSNPAIWGKDARGVNTILLDLRVLLGDPRVRRIVIKDEGPRRAARVLEDREQRTYHPRPQDGDKVLWTKKPDGEFTLDDFRTLSGYDVESPHQRARRAGVPGSVESRPFEAPTPAELAAMRKNRTVDVFLAAEPVAAPVERTSRLTVHDAVERVREAWPSWRTLDESDRKHRVFDELIPVAGFHVAMSCFKEFENGNLGWTAP